MGDADTTDPYEGYDSLNFGSTDTIDEGEELLISSTSGTEPENSYWEEFQSGISPYTESSEIKPNIFKRIENLEQETNKLWRVSNELSQMQQVTEFTNTSQMLIAIERISKDMTEIESRLNELNEETREETSPVQDAEENSNIHSDEKDKRERVQMKDTYIAISQVVFLALGILAIILSTYSTDSFLGFSAAFTVPVFLILTFGGVVAERIGINSQT